ncbi:SgcJ/EcaC family oxidoreductase [Pseudomonas purpurea]|uniref:YybH family protein n=1 Tax=Pseudomonas purpurea TaxID=3136737 RepID=UPI003265BE90
MNAPTENTEIQALIETYRQAVITKDVEKVMGLYADNIVSFDAVSALQFKGKVAYRAHWEACMTMCPGPHVFEFHQMDIVTAQDMAFAHWLAHCGGTDDKGETKACWMRVTAGYQRVGGQWRIVHEHWSAPFDMVSGAVLFDLHP